MSTLNEVAADHQARVASVSERAASRAVSLWGEVSTESLDDGWDVIAPQLDSLMSTAQVTAASLSGSYVSRSMRLQGLPAPDARVLSSSFAGVTREGRAVVAELFTAVTTAKDLIKSGAGVGRAFQSGAAVMSVIAANVVRDSGRGADSTVAASAGATKTVRVIQPGACSRCAELAGITGVKPFERHPRCRCTNMVIPATGEAPEGFYVNARDYFDDLSASEQDRIFTKAGAEAIRLGADPSKVVTARRGANRAGSRGQISQIRRAQIGVGANGEPILGYVTSEGTTVRGSFGRARQNLTRGPSDRYRRTQTRRLMPETILELTDDVELRKVLLRDAGYMDFPLADTRRPDWLSLRAQRQADDNAVASDFYRGIGIT